MPFTMTQQRVLFSSSLGQQLQENLQPRILISSAAAGLVTGIIGVIRAISYASLIFSGALAVYLPTGLGVTVFSTAATLAVVALASGMAGIIATPLAAPTAILAAMAAGIAADMAAAPPEEVLATVLLMIVLSSLATGALLLGLGLLNQGRRLRIIPYPVIGGFMAGTGWLLTRGFFQITADLPLAWNALGALVTPPILSCWLPGLGFAIALLIATRRWQQFWVMPATLLACGGLFYLGLWGTGTSLEAARAAGWLLGPFPEGDSLWHPLTLQQVSQVRWQELLHQGGGVLTVMLVSLLSLMLSNSSIELVVGRDLNLSHELKAVGLANVMSGLGGGMVGNQALPSTLLVQDMGAKHRLTGLFAVLPSVAVLALGSSFLAYLPKAVLGSVILYLGLSLLWKWLYEAYPRLPLWDYLTVWATLIVIDALGFLQGIAAGFVLTVIGFMYCYSQVDVASQVSSGRSTRSNVDRSPAEESLLARQGDRIYVLELKGFLFFGTAHYLLSKVRDRIQPSANSGGDTPLKYLLIDFRQVQGLDSSAVLTFDKILKLARQHDFLLVLTNLSAALEQELRRGADLAPERCQRLPDIDRGLEWCEQQLLPTLAAPPTAAPHGLAERLAQLFLTPEQAERFLTYLQPETFAPGQYVFRQGASHTGLYFIASGQVSVLLEQGNAQNKRLQTCTSGHLLGEMRFYDKVPLSTSVVADKPSQLYALSKSTYKQMQQTDPDLVQALQAHIVNLLCDSLLRREQQLRVIQ